MRKPMHDYTEICLKDGNGIYTIQVDKTGMSCQELVNDVVRNVLLAAGFVEASVDAVLGPYGSERVDEDSHAVQTLDKILDALGAENTDDAMVCINDIKSIAAGRLNKLAAIREASGAELGKDVSDAVRGLKRKADNLDKMMHSIDVYCSDPNTTFPLLLSSGNGSTVKVIKH